MKDDTYVFDVVAINPIQKLLIPYIPEFKTFVLIDDISELTYVKTYQKGKPANRICVVPFSDNTQISPYGYELREK